MTTKASQDELDSLRERLTWRDSDLVFSTHGRNMTREHMRGVGSEFIALVLQAGDGAVLRSFDPWMASCSSLVRQPPNRRVV
jgi:hypothetical protein